MGRTVELTFQSLGISIYISVSTVNIVMLEYVSTCQTFTPHKCARTPKQCCISKKWLLLVNPLQQLEWPGGRYQCRFSMPMIGTINKQHVSRSDWYLTAGSYGPHQSRVILIAV